jgi:hypothetical protein
MLKNILLIGLFIYSLIPLYAQSADTLNGTNNRQPHFIIKWAPLSLVEQDNTVQFGIEYLFKGPVSLQQEVGYGWFNFTNNSDNGRVFKNREIWRSRTELRFYVANNGEIRRPQGAYLALEFLYKRMNYNKGGNVGRECNGSECEYFEMMNYKLFRDIFGYHGKIGLQFIIEKRLALDLYIGGGLRSIVVKSPGLSAEDSNFREERGFVMSKPMELGQYTLLSMCSGFKLGFLIYKRHK